MLKTGAHLWGLEHLLETYPDARIVFTHRDPVKSMTSYASLTTLVRGAGSDEVDPSRSPPTGPRACGRAHRPRASPCAAAKDYPDAIFYDMLFTDFVPDQFAVIREHLRGLRAAHDRRGRRAA